MRLTPTLLLTALLPLFAGCQLMARRAKRPEYRHHARCRANCVPPVASCCSSRAAKTARS